MVQALDVGLTTGALTRNDAASIQLPVFNGLPWYASGVAASPDGKRLLVSGVTDSLAYVHDIDPASPTYGKALGPGRPRDLMPAAGGATCERCEPGHAARAENASFSRFP